MFEKAQKAVEEFHRAFNHPIGEKPRMMPIELFNRRVKWMKEEIRELEESSNMVDDLDALADLMYFILGFFVEMGINGSEIFEIVHRANMTKLREGKVEYYPDGKVRKPDDWTPPEDEIREYLKSLGIINSGVLGEVE